MEGALFDGLREISNEEVSRKMEYFKDRAQEGMKLYEVDKKQCLELAKELRKELKKEYKNNDLLRTQERYKNHDLFLSHYKWAVHEAYASVTGTLSYKKLFSFLYDVKYYMNHYLRSEIGR